MIKMMMMMLVASHTHNVITIVLSSSSFSLLVHTTPLSVFDVDVFHQTTDTKGTPKNLMLGRLCASATWMIDAVHGCGRFKVKKVRGGGSGRLGFMEFDRMVVFPAFLFFLVRA